LVSLGYLNLISTNQGAGDEEVKRVYFLAAAAVVAIAASYLSAYIPPELTRTAHWLEPVAVSIADLVMLPFAFVVGAVLFDLVASGIRYSVLAEIGRDYLTRARAFVNRLLRRLEVRHGGRGTVGLTTL
jgi:hypothetical protein